MSEPWRTVRLVDVTTKIGSGATPRGGASVYIDQGTAFLRSQNVLDFRFDPTGLVYITDAAAAGLDGVTVKPGDVLVNITGDSVARVCLAPTMPARVSQHVAIVRPDPSVLLPNFLLYALLDPSAKKRLLALSAGGSTRKALTKAHLQSFEIRLPGVDTQRRVVEVLELLDAQVETNRAIADRCAALALALIESAGTTVSLSTLATELRPAASTQTGTIDHFSLPAFDVDGLPERVDASQILSNKLPLANPSVLVSRLNPHIPRVWMAYPEHQVPAAASTEFVVLGSGAAEVEEIWAVCACQAFVQQLQRLATGTTGSHQRVDKAALGALLVPDVRSLTEETRRTIVTLVREAHASRMLARRLSAARDDLLPLLMAGDLAVLEGKAA